MPYGYEIEKVMDGDRERSRWTINEEEASVIRQLFELSATGKTTKQLLSFLNSSNLKPRIVTEWSTFIIRHILQGRYYTGQRSYDGVIQENSHPAIISKELFETVRKRERDGRVFKKRLPEFFFSLELPHVPSAGKNSDLPLQKII